MSRRKGARGSTGGARAGRASGKQKKALLLFGEDDSDCCAIKALVEGLRPGLRGHVETRRKPLVLIKGVTPEELRARKRSLVAQVRIDRARLDVRGVIVHEDCDRCEPAHEAVAQRYDREFAGADFAVYPVLPAWEIEAWWLLWPSMLPAYRSSWRAPTEYRGRHVGMIVNAKEALKAAVRPRSLSIAQRANFRTYEESDSPGIAALLVERGVLDKPEGKSESYMQFRQTVATIIL